MALGVFSGLVLVGCRDDGADENRACAFEDETVTIFGPEVEDEQQSLKRAFATLERDECLTVQLTGHRDFEERLDSLVAGGNPPDIAMFPQPGKVRDFAEDVVPLPDDPDDPDDLGSIVRDSFDDEWTDLVTVDTQLLAVPAKVDFKSLVWYSPDQFERHDYQIPTTFEGFLDLAEQMAEDGNTPFCLGLQSEFATGWPLTDWIEDFLLRINGPELYDAWYQHDIPFDHPAVVAAATRVYELLSREGYVYQGLESSAARPYYEAGTPVLTGDCMMYRMPNWYRANWPETVHNFGPDGEIDAFYLPGSAAHPHIALVGGSYAAAFSSDRAVMTTMDYIADEDFADPRASYSTGGFLSPNDNIAASQYPTALDQELARMVAAAEPVRFDASDLMPGAVGSGSFWRASVDISTGEKTVAEAFAEIEQNWPQE